MRETPIYELLFSSKRAGCGMKPIAHNGLVPGSSPGGPTNYINDLAGISGALAGFANLTPAERASVEVRALAIWQNRERQWPARVRRMEPDAMDRVTGAWARVVAQAMGEQS